MKNAKLERGDSIKLIDGRRVTVRNIREEEGKFFYIFHEIIVELSELKLIEDGVI